MKKILFQGDSITDAGRSRQNTRELGVGYPHLIKAMMNCNAPGEYEFINKGISGNRIVDVYARIKADIINLAPDVMTILIGINDIWHEIDFKNGIDAEKFERIYAMLIEEVREALPDIRIVILEPFVLPASATTGELEGGVDKYAYFREETELRAAAAKRIAEKFGLEFIPLQKLFDEKAQLVSPAYWLGDGVHPTEAGHMLIANEVIKVIF